MPTLAPALPSQIQSSGRDRRATGQQPQRRNAVHDRPGEESQHEHDRRRVDEEQRALGLVLQHASHDVLNPAVGAELRRRQQEHHQHQEHEHRPAERANPQPERNGRHKRVEQGLLHRNRRDVEHGEHLADAHDDQERHDVGAAPAKFGEHFAERHARFDALLHGKALAEQQKSVEQNRQQQDRHFPLPKLARQLRVDRRPATRRSPTAPPRPFRRANRRAAC